MSDNTNTTNSAEVILEIQDLCKSFGDHEVLKGISTTIRKGDVLALIGPSGCGKSTLLELIAGLIPLQKGSLRYPFLNQPPSIGYMLQKDHLLEYRTIYKNIIL